MKKLLLATAGLLSLGIVSAQAADVAPRMATKAPVYAAPALYNWTGPYVGLSGGGSFASGSDAGIVGGTIGYNWQAGSPWVFGLEGDFNWLSHTNAAVRNNWLSTIRGRVGYAMGATGSWMPYITGGVAFGDVSHSVAGAGMVSDTKTGWTLGAGVEAALVGAWTVKAEYLYVDLGSGPTLAGVGSSYDTHLIRAGLNYRF